MSDITFFVLAMVLCGVLGILIGMSITMMFWIREDKKNILDLLELSHGLDAIHTGLTDMYTELNKGE